MNTMTALDSLVANVSALVWRRLVSVRQALVVAERIESKASEAFLDATDGLTRAEIEADPALVILRDAARAAANACGVIREEIADHEAALRSRPVMA